jgi:hypothetical protein
LWSRGVRWAWARPSSWEDSCGRSSSG